MLKLNYTEVGLHMERSMSAPELLIAQRVILAMRLEQPLHVEPGRACFLLPAAVPELEQLEQMLQRKYGQVFNSAPIDLVDLNPVDLNPVDDDFVEVGLSGSWVAETHEAHEGMFLCMMSNSIESIIYRLWQTSTAQFSLLA